MIAALFVQKNGAYFGLQDVDPWDQDRDARRYAGPHRVVAHPPCQRWCTLASSVAARGGPAVGDDAGCFASALASVRAFGGVLEHPAYSRAFEAFGLPRPVRGSWQAAPGGFVTEISQVVYGHKARKRTWLYLSGTPTDLDWREWPGSHRVGSTTAGRYQRDGSVKRIPFREWKPSLSQADADATPPAFRDLLIMLALS